MNRPDNRIAEPQNDRSPRTGLVQADPQLQLSEGRASVFQIVAVAFACMLIVGVTLYGLGRPATTDGEIMVSAPPAQETTGAATPAEPAAAQTGGNVAGGDNVAPADAAPQDIPAQEPVPQQVKPGVVGSDSAR